MRCVKCNHQQKHIEGLTCKSCGYHYVFDPKKGFNDNRMKSLIDKISTSGAVYYTKNQLYAAYSFRAKFDWVKLLISIVIFAIFSWFIYSVFEDPAWIFAIIAFSFFYMLNTNFKDLKSSVYYSPSEFDSKIKEWQKNHEMPNLLTKPSLHSPPPTFKENDLHNYGLEGILVVDQDIFVDLFVKNNCHIDWKMAVIAQSGYPSYLLDNIQKTIDQKPDIKIHYLHNADTNLASMQSNIRRHLKMPNTIIEIDLGLTHNPTNVNTKKQKPFMRGDGLQKAKVDYLSPTRLSSSLKTALVSGLLLEDALATTFRKNTHIDDFG